MPGGACGAKPSRTGIERAGHSAAIEVLISEAPPPALPASRRLCGFSQPATPPAAALCGCAAAVVAARTAPPSLDMQPWCVGNVAASQLTPRLGQQRLRVLQLVAHGQPGYLLNRPLKPRIFLLVIHWQTAQPKLAGKPSQPRIWEDDPSAGAPDHVEEVWAQQRQQLERRDLAERRRRSVASMAASRAAWMQPPPPRPGPADRREVARLGLVEACAAPVAPAQQRQPAALPCVAVDAAQQHPISGVGAARGAPRLAAAAGEASPSSGTPLCRVQCSLFAQAVSPVCPARFAAVGRRT